MGEEGASPEEPEDDLAPGEEGDATVDDALPIFPQHEDDDEADVDQEQDG